MFLKVFVYFFSFPESSVFLSISSTPYSSSAGTAINCPILCKAKPISNSYKWYPHHSNAISIIAANSLNVIFACIGNLLHVGGCDSFIVTFI